MHTHAHTHTHTHTRLLAICAPSHSVSDVNLILGQLKCTGLSNWNHSRLEMTSITDLPKPKTLATASHSHAHTHTHRVSVSFSQISRVCPLGAIQLVVLSVQAQSI